MSFTPPEDIPVAAVPSPMAPADQGVPVAFVDSAPATPVMAEAAPWQRPQEAPIRPDTLGRTAMFLAIGVFVVSIIASVLIGVTIGPAASRTSSGGWYFNTNSTTNTAAIAASLASVAHVLLGSIVGIGALVMGIVAAATRRGRKFGIVAIVVAALAPGLSLTVYVVAVFATLPPLR